MSWTVAMSMGGSSSELSSPLEPWSKGRVQKTLKVGIVVTHNPDLSGNLSSMCLFCLYTSLTNKLCGQVDQGFSSLGCLCYFFL